jgi:type I restriction enzyme M protein
MSRAKTRKGDTTANLGFEAKLWAAADALRNNMDAAEYKHVVLGLIFLKYISDAFEAKHTELAAQKSQGADPEDPDEYRAASIFWVPKEARWAHLKASAPQPTIGTLVDDAMAAIERDNPSLKGVLPKDYARPGLDKQRLGQIINLVSDIALGDNASKSKDTLGLLLLDHPHGTFPDFFRIPLRCSHDSILSKIGVSGKPGAIHIGRAGRRRGAPMPNR